MPASVRGVTTAPMLMPSRMKNTRATGVGTVIGRPASAATATHRIAPERKPAGNFAIASVVPPATAIRAVSATLRNLWGEEDDDIWGLIPINAAWGPAPSNEYMQCSKTEMHAFADRHSAGLTARQSATPDAGPRPKRRERAPHPDSSQSSAGP